MGVSRPQHSRPCSSGAQKQPGFLAGWGAGQRCSGSGSRWGCGTVGTEVQPHREGPRPSPWSQSPRRPQIRGHVPLMALAHRGVVDGITQLHVCVRSVMSNAVRPRRL